MSATDGKQVRRYHAPFDGITRENSGGIISDTTLDRVGNAEYLMPAWFACRANAAEISTYLASDFVDSGEKADVRGMSCAEYHYSNKAGRTEIVTAWFDPACAFALRRIRHEYPQGSTTLIDVDYAERDGDWYPTNWTVTRHNSDGTLSRTRRVTVTQLKIGGTYDEKEFVPAFPNGMRVEDVRTQQRYLVGEDGTLEADPFGDIGDILKNNLGLLIAVGVVLALVIGLTVYLRIRRRRRLAAAPGKA